MPNRFTRNTAILAKVETTYGIDAVPTGAANALLISNASVQINSNNVARDIVRPYMGASEELVGTRSVVMSFEVELAGSGVAGTAPAWGPLVRACGMSETVTASTRVDYTPVSSAFESLTMYYSVDGVLYKALGCRGTFEMMANIGERPMLKFSFTGLDGGATAAANPTVTLTAWKTPLVVTDTNSGDVKLGGTYSAGVISGGTAYPSRGLALNIGASVVYQPLLGGESVLISNRDTTGSVTLDLTAAQEVSFRTSINANTLSSVSIEHGTTAGYKVLAFAPAAQQINPQIVDQDGVAMLSMGLRLTPSSGNDELRLVAL